MSIASSPDHPSGTPIRIILGDDVVNGQLGDNATARDLRQQLPLTLILNDFNRVEQIAALPRALSTDGVPRGDDPEINDIGYYTPSGDLVLYYGDVGFWNGIVRLGQFDTNATALIEGQPDGCRVTIELAD